MGAYIHNLSITLLHVAYSSKSDAILSIRSIVAVVYFLLFCLVFNIFSSHLFSYYNRARDFQILNLDAVQDFVNMGRLSPKENGMITMRDLVTCGLISQIQDGVKILSKGGSNFSTKIHLEVSQASGAAIQAVERAGGTITCVHFNALGTHHSTKLY